MNDVSRFLFGGRYPYPLHWPRHAANFRRVSVQKDSEEWSRAAQQLADTLPTARVVAVQRCACVLFCMCRGCLRVQGLDVPLHGVERRVQNRYLWNRYMHEQRLIEQQLKARVDAVVRRGANEQWLWHGTSDTNPWVICCGLDGVDFRMVRTCVSVPVRYRTHGRLCHVDHTPTL